MKENTDDYSSKEHGSKYVENFNNLKVNKSGNVYSPHKAILLITVAELIEKQVVLSPFIPLSKELEAHFKEVWKRYVPENKGHKCVLHYPFFYMKSESFWTLSPILGYIQKSSYGSLSDLKKNFYGAVIDKELYKAFSNKESRKMLISILISKYLTPTEVSSQVESKVKTGKLLDSVVQNEGLIEVAEPSNEYGVIGDYRIVDYSEKAFAVYGNTSHLAKKFKELWGSFNVYLKDGPAWVFSKKRRKEVYKLLSAEKRLL